MQEAAFGGANKRSMGVNQNSKTIINGGCRSINLKINIIYRVFFVTCITKSREPNIQKFYAGSRDLGRKTQLARSM